MNSLRTIAHESLCLTEGPYLKHYLHGRFRLWNGVAFTGSSLPGAGFNFAAVLGAAPPLDEILPVAREFFAITEKGWGILVEADAGHPIEAEVKARDWTIDEDEPAYVMERIRNPVSALETGFLIGPETRFPKQKPGFKLGPDLIIRYVQTQLEEAVYHSLVAMAFGAPFEFASQMLPTIPYAGASDIALFLGSLDGSDIAAAGYSRSGSTAVVWGVATLKPYRGRGFGAALSRAALVHAAAQGCTSASLRSGPKSRPLYERLGFRYVCNHRTYAARPA